LAVNAPGWRYPESTEQSISHARALTFHDILAASVTFGMSSALLILWPLPWLRPEYADEPVWATYRTQPFCSFLLLNPAPEIIYQVRHDSPLDVFKTSYEFVLENRIEWFLPFAVILTPIVLSPMGLRSFFSLSSRAGRGAGLDFSQLLVLPFTILGGWLDYAGIPPSISWYLGLLFTPPLAVAMLLFRGHLFASLHGVSRRQRRFVSPFK
jgi:hypothetical protein